MAKNLIEHSRLEKKRKPKSREGEPKKLVTKGNNSLMYKFTEQDVRLIREVQLRFDEFISEPERTDIWCHRCQTYVEQGRMPTKSIVIAARCECGTEAVLMSEYRTLNQDDWDRIINAI